MSPLFEPPHASAGPIFAGLLLRHSLPGSSVQVSLHRIMLISNLSKRVGLTESSLFGLLYRKGDGRQQFDKDLYDNLGHRSGGWDLCIDIEAPEKGLEGLEKVNKCIIARANIFD